MYVRVRVCMCICVYVCMWGVAYVYVVHVCASRGSCVWCMVRVRVGGVACGVWSVCVCAVRV